MDVTKGMCFAGGNLLFLLLSRDDLRIMNVCMYVWINHGREVDWVGLRGGGDID